MNLFFECLPAFGRGGAGYRIRLFGEQCLSGASCAAILFGAGVEFTRRVAHGRKWFWVLLPKQKNLVARGRNPASNKWKN